MKSLSLFPLLYLLSFTFIQAEVMLAYKFRTHEAKVLYNNQKGDESVHKAPAVKRCGTDHLKGNDRTAYEKCIKDLKLPADFEPEALALQPADFASPTIFDNAYNRKLVNYVEKLDQKFEGPAKPVTLEFSMNWLALALVPMAFGIIYFINKPKAPVKDEEANKSNDTDSVVAA